MTQRMDLVPTDFDEPSPPLPLLQRRPSGGPAGPLARAARAAGPLARPLGGPGGPPPGRSALSPRIDGQIQRIRRSVDTALQKANDELNALVAQRDVKMPQAPIRRASGGSAAAAAAAADAAARGDDYDYDIKDAPPFRPPRRRTTPADTDRPYGPQAPFGPQRPPRRPQGQRVIERKQYSNVEDCSRDLMVCEQRLPNGKIPKVLQNLEIPQGHDLQSTSTFFYWKANGTGRQYWSQHQLERYLCGGYEPMLANNEVRRELERRRDLYLQQYASCKRGNRS